MMNQVSLSQIIGENGIFIDGDWIESKDQDPNGSVRLIQLADIGEGNFINKSRRFLTHEKAHELRCTYLMPEDVLIARMPDPIGRACIFPGIENPCITVVDVCIVRPDKSIVSPKWLTYQINSFDFRNKIQQYITGTTRQRISRGNLERIKFNIPPLDEQHRVVKLLDQAHLLTKDRKQAIDLLDKYLQSMFIEMFGENTDNFGSWEKVRLQSLALDKKGSMRTGPFGSDLKHSEFVESGIAVIGIDNAVQNKFAWDQRRYITEEKYQKLKRYTLFPNDVVITIMATTGRSAVIPENIPLSINTKHLAAITLDLRKANPYFISYSIHSDPRIVRQIQGKNRGAIMPGLNLGIIKDLEFIMPPVDLQNKFSDILLSTEKLKQKMMLQSEEIDNQFQSLMQKSFYG